ncbi:hypothetical protein [Reyranella sp.]|jgi:hypothetical protein|uniref:hypothetical protein n=1 Tax=Reyranella sp. TaxID=1929291 RepID=UPI00262A9D65|nr:hypothetical protein [Reyranella sp.]
MGTIMTSAEMQADIAERIAGLDPVDAARFRHTVEFMLEVSAAVLAAPYAARHGLYRAAVVEGEARGLDLRSWPECYGPSVEKYLRGMRQVAGNAELVTRGTPTSH